MDNIVQIFEGFGLKYIETIAKGSYGTVYKVFSYQYQQEFALKKIPAEKFNDSEIQCMIEIRSSNIVPLYKYYRYQKSVYLLMEYCPRSIDSFILEGPTQSLEKQYQIANGLAMALKSCHDFGIYHGDVKPSNFLIDKYGRIKICDFGFSQKIETDEYNTEFRGTIFFEAPEIINKQPFDCFAADIWSLGVTLFIVLTGQLPWNFTSKDAMLKSINNALFDEFFIKDDFLRSIVTMCMKIDPKQRPTAAEIVNLLKGKLETTKKRIIRPVSSALFASPLIKSQTHSRIRPVSSF